MIYFTLKSAKFKCIQICNHTEGPHREIEKLQPEEHSTDHLKHFFMAYTRQQEFPQK
jgi:hypothetical protein